jgi:hypothetical protein
MLYSDLSIVYCVCTFCIDLCNVWDVYMYVVYCLVHCIRCIYVMIALRTIFAVHVLYFYLYALFVVRML